MGTPLYLNIHAFDVLTIWNGMDGMANLADDFSVPASC